MLHSTKSAYFS